MQIPSAEFIEVARDQVKAMEEAQAGALPDQEKELQSALGDDFDLDISTGYTLGIQTARVLLATHPLLAEKGIKADDLL